MGNVLIFFFNWESDYEKHAKYINVILSINGEILECIEFGKLLVIFLLTVKLMSEHSVFNDVNTNGMFVLLLILKYFSFEGL